MVYLAITPTEKDEKNQGNVVAKDRYHICGYIKGSFCKSRPEYKISGNIDGI